MSIERYHERSKKSYTFILYIVGLIFLIAFLQYGYLLLLETAILAFVLAIIFQVYKFLEQISFEKSTGGILQGKTKPSFFDSFLIARNYFSINKKYIFMSTVGLILVVIVISQQILITTSYQQATYDAYIDGNDTTALKFEVYQMNESVYADWQEFAETNARSWIKSPDLEIESQITEGNIEFKVLMGHTYNLDTKTRYAHTVQLMTHQWNKFYYDFYSLLPSFPGFEFNESESIMIIPPNLQESLSGVGTSIYELDDFIEVVEGKPHMKVLVNPDTLTIYNASEPWIFNNFSYPVDRVWQMSSQDLAFIYSDKYQFPNDFQFGQIYFPEGKEWEFYNNIISKQDEFGQVPYIWGSVGFTTLIKIRQPLITEMPLSEVQFILDESVYKTKFEITNFVNGHQSYAEGYGRQNVRFLLTSPLSTLINRFEDGFYLLDDWMALSTTPLIMISLFLMFFSLSLIEKRKERIFSMMMTRGTSITQIRLMIIYEILLSSIVASVIGLALSIPISKIFLRSAGVLDFTGNPVPLIIPTVWWIKAPLLGLLLALLFNSISLYSVAQLDIEESMDYVKTKPPVWERYNLDLILFLFSQIYWFIILFLPISDIVSKSLFNSYGRTMLLISIIGYPWVVGRYFIGGIARSLRFLKLRFDTLTMAITNVSANKIFTGQLISILMVGMMMTSMSLATSETISNAGYERSLYNLGADIVLENLDFNDTNIQDALNVTGVEAYSFGNSLLYERGLLEVPPGEDPNNWPITHFLAIDTDTFSKAAFWKDDYDEDSLEEIIESLERSENGMITQKDYAKAFNLTVGNKYAFQYGANAERTFEFNISSTVDYFPRIFNHFPQKNQFGFYEKNDLVIVTTMENLNIIYENLGRQTLQNLIYVKVARGFEVEEVVVNLNDALIPVTTTQYKIFDYKSEAVSFLSDENYFEITRSQTRLVNEENDFLTIAVHSTLIFTFIIIMMAIGSYSFVFISTRTREIGLYRALGMTRRQIRKLLFYEISMMVLISIISGVLAGYFLSYVSFVVLFNKDLNPIPPFKTYVPYDILIYFSIFVAAIGLVIASIPAWQHSRQQTGSILRAK